MSIALHLPCRLLTPKLSPTQVVLAHLPHRCSPSSGDHLPLLFVTGYSRMSFGIFQRACSASCSGRKRGFVAGRRSLATTSLYLAQNRTGRKPLDHPGEDRAQTCTSGSKRRGYHPAGPGAPPPIPKAHTAAHKGKQGGTSHRGCGNKKRRLHSVQSPTWVAVRRICCTNWSERSAALLWRRREKHNNGR